MKREALATLALCSMLGCASEPAASVTVGSKKFTESVVLGELASHMIEDAGMGARHRPELGGTRILWKALRMGEIDVYPDYSGTLAVEILGGRVATDHAALSQALAKQGVVLGKPLGFENTYAIGMREENAARLGIRSISDLKAHPELRYGLTAEFLDRKDGWPGLSRAYGLTPREVRGLDHDLAYRGLEAASFEVTDVYTTDADIDYYKLRVLEDDRGYFPEYRAMMVYRADFVRAQPEAHAAIERLANRIDATTMRRLNYQVKLEKRSEAAVAAGFVAEHFETRPRAAGPGSAHSPGRGERLLRHGSQHLTLVAISLLAAIAVALPLGIVAARRRRLGQLIIGVVGVLQTIPSLALLVFMIPLFGIGASPAIAALFVYSLLPIVRNTHAGLSQLPLATLESASAMGLSDTARLCLVELPLAAPSILAGIKTAAVINVGTATLGALIGAGGFGQPILTGIRLDDHALILEGAIPAAVLAVVASLLFDGLERLLVSPGLRIGR
ncbi:MAG: ABC transporter permease subunit [Myxococcales bacterium]|nr:ABC transporter permease subunit [Myxococcales bacterium]